MAATLAVMRGKQRFAPCTSPKATALICTYAMPGRFCGMDTCMRPTRTYAGPQRAHAAEHAAPHGLWHVRPEAGSRPPRGRAALPDSRALVVQQRLQHARSYLKELASSVHIREMEYDSP